MGRKRKVTPPEERSEGATYTVKKIVNHRYDGDGKEWLFKVRWAGYGKDADTEEPVESFIDTELLIEYIARSAKLVEAFKDSDLVRPAKKAKRKGATNGHAPAPLFKQESPEPAKTVIKRSGSSEDEPLIHKRREMQMPKLEEEEPSLEPALPLRPIPRKASEAPAPPVKKQRVKPKPARSVSFETTASQTPAVSYKPPYPASSAPPTPAPARQPTPASRPHPAPTAIAQPILRGPTTPASTSTRPTAFDAIRNDKDALVERLRGSHYLPARAPFTTHEALANSIWTLIHLHSQFSVASSAAALINTFAVLRRDFAFIVASRAENTGAGIAGRKDPAIELDVLALSYVLLVAGLRQRQQLLTAWEEQLIEERQEVVPAPLIFVHASEEKRLASLRLLDLARQGTGPFVLWGRGDGTRFVYDENIAAITFHSQSLCEHNDLLSVLVASSKCKLWCSAGLVTVGGPLDVNTITGETDAERLRAKGEMLMALADESGHAREMLLNPAPTTAIPSYPFPGVQDVVPLQRADIQVPLSTNAAKEFDEILALSKTFFARYSSPRRWFIVAPDAIAAEVTAEHVGPIEVYSYDDICAFLS